MPLTIACKLVHGISVGEGAARVNINGANADYNDKLPPMNGDPNDGRNTVAGYGLTELTDAQAKAWADWKKSVTERPDGSKLPPEESFPALSNGVIEEFKSMDEARKSLPALSSMVTTGVEGLDADAELAKSTAGDSRLEATKD